MRAIREEQVAQAIQYLRKMKCVKIFVDAVCQSPEFLRKLWSEIHECPQLDPMMKKLEESGSLPYYVSHEFLPFGECYTILTVSPYTEDFALSMPRYDEEMNAYRVYAYVWNVTDDSRSEPGSVWMQSLYGGLTRIL